MAPAKQGVLMGGGGGGRRGGGEGRGRGGERVGRGEGRGRERGGEGKGRGEERRRGGERRGGGRMKEILTLFLVSRVVGEVKLDRKTLLMMIFCLLISECFTNILETELLSQDNRYK